MRLDPAPATLALSAALALAAACARAPAPEQHPPAAPRVATTTNTPAPRFEISVPTSVEADPLDGRLYLMLSTDGSEEPRFQVANWRGGQPFFGLDVDGLAPGQQAVFDGDELGHPVARLLDLPPGDYYVQALLHRYETFHRADGHVVKLPADNWEGQNWRISPGNLYSDVQRVRIGSSRSGTVRLSLDHEVPPKPDPVDTEYVKHIKIRSDILSEFWGRDIYIGATVLLPEGWADHPDARYPTVWYQGHFHDHFYIPVSFREMPPEPDLTGYDSTYAAASYQFYRDWTSGALPRMIIVTMQHPTPYFDDSYAVNSENNGPYGDALTQELLPLVERKFRGIGSGWARTLYGGSTGGWESLAWQIFYPDMFNGVWSACPDPVDFRYYGLVDIYEDENAFYPDREWEKNSTRPWMHEPDGEILMTVQEASQMELVLGTHGRSGQQYDAWQAVYAPVGPDGYPRELWDKQTGKIDHEVAEAMREYDLRYVLARDWHRGLGEKLQGKLHVAVGLEDSFYLEEAVRLLEDFLEGTTHPYYDGSFDYGSRHQHCYSGVPELPVSLSRLTYPQRFLPKMAEHIFRTAPAGADVTSWKY